MMKSTTTQPTPTPKSNPGPESSNSLNQTPTSHQTRSRAAKISHDRQFNVVLYGIAECAQGTNRKTRDISKVEEVIGALNCGVNNHSIRDCVRLGKYRTPNTSTDLKKPRPLLVNLSRVTDAQQILTKKGAVPKPYIIKPDLSKEKRLIEATLLKERWTLIQTGTDRSSIKIRDSKLFVSNTLYGSASGSAFTPSVSRLPNPNPESEGSPPSSP